MIRSIEIKNLRGIQDGKLEDLTTLTILVGPNGCGKSTILDALLIGASPTPGSAIVHVASKRTSREARWLFWRAGQDGNAVIRITPYEHVIRECRLTYVPTESEDETP